MSTTSPMKRLKTIGLSLLVLVTAAGLYWNVYCNSYNRADHIADYYGWKYGDDYVGLVNKAKYFAYKKDYYQAYEILDRVIEKDAENSAKYLWLKGEIELKEGGRSYFNSFSEYTKLKPEDPQGHLMEGKAYFIDQDYIRALPPLKKAIRLDDSLLEASTMLAEAYLDLSFGNDISGRDTYLKAGLAHCNNSIQLSPFDSSLYAIRALFKMGQKKYGEAIHDLNLVLKNDPKNVDYRMARLECYLKLNKLDEARKEATVLASLPNIPWRATLLIAEMQKENGEIEKALATLEPIADPRSSKGEVFLLKGLCLDHMGKYSEALGLYKKAERNNAPIPHYIAGRLYLDEKNWSDADSEFRKAIKKPSIDKHLALLFKSRTGIEKDMFFFPQSDLKDLDEALALNPNSGLNYLTRAELKERILREEHSMMNYIPSLKGLKTNRYKDILKDLEKAEALGLKDHYYQKRAETLKQKTLSKL